MAEAERNRLPSGHDEEFVSEVDDDFHCLICHLPLKEPVLTRCGHRFCRDCLEEHLRRQKDQAQPYTCPADREGLDRDRDVFPDKATERKILSLAVKCPSEGCEWTGELRNKELHLSSCPDIVVSCTNENCHVTLQKKYLQVHVNFNCDWRINKCEYCKEPHPLCHMQDHLIRECTKFPVICPNNCGDLVPREMIPDHTENRCPLTSVSCSYVQMGCKEKVQRKNLPSHLQSAMQDHLDMVCAELKHTQETTRNLEEKVETLQRQLEEKTSGDQGNGNTRFIWRIKKFSEILGRAKERGQRIESPAFYTEKYGYKLKISINPRVISHELSGFIARGISASVVLMKGEYDAILPWPFNRKVILTLIDQQPDPVERQNLVCENNFNTPKPKHVDVELVSLSVSYEKLQTSCYTVDDTLFLQAEVTSS